MKPDYIPVLIFLIPFVVAGMLPVFFKSRNLSSLIACAAVAGSGFFSLQGLVRVSDGNVLQHYMGGWLPPFGIEWHLDGLSAVMALLVNAVALVVLLSTRHITRREVHRSTVPFYMIVLLHLSALLGMILTHDLFNLFVFLELASLTGYALVATGDKRRGNVASMRYLLLGTIGASFYLLGVGYLYAATGTLNMSDLALRIGQVGLSRTSMLGIFLVVLGLGIKCGLFPFHAWMPDAYTHASDTAAALIAPLTTKVILYSLIRVLFWCFDNALLAELNVFTVLLCLGSMALITGSVMAFVQTNFKRMLAYSSVAQIGLIVLALGLNEKTAFLGAALHIIHHAAMKAVLFLTAGAAFDAFKIRQIRDFSKLKTSMPWTVSAFLLAALSMIGIPPLCGFFSKWYIVVGAFRAGQPMIAAVIVGSSLLTAMYFFKVIEVTSFKKQQGEPKVVETVNSLTLGISLLAASLIFLGLAAPVIYNWGLQHLLPMGF